MFRDEKNESLFQQMLAFLLHLGAIVGKQVLTTVYQDHRTLEETEDMQRTFTSGALSVN